MAELDFMTEVEVRKAKMILKPYRNMPKLHSLALRAILRVAYDGGDIGEAAFKAALALSQEESCQGYEWALKERRGNRPVYAILDERKIA
ncbi:hypothetical protein [Kitasatospora sp. MBT66]|uniref:hypothetical protein n=1 Tax=Kitasatospora sp. MBT66 TaxID=1444769 RepID=UPI0011EA6B44|nr:hypothetical protein [Kitasatospora sp. MBT66]